MRINKLLAVILILCCAWAGGCNNGSSSKASPSRELPAPIPKDSLVTKTMSWSLKDYYSAEPALDAAVDSIYRSLSVADRAAQMIMAATSEYKGIGLPFDKIKALYRNRVIGSVLFLKGRRKVFANQVTQIKELSKKNDLFPSVFACDCEPSLFHKKFTDADSLTPANQLRSVADVNAMAKTIGGEMKKMGFHWNFAPVADISLNKEVIDHRSFGNNNTDVVNKSSAFIQTSYEDNIVTSVKHFPGHGAVKGDSHKSLVYIDSSLTELENFSAIIRQSNPVSVMIGHIAIRRHAKWETKGLPATLSRPIISALLQDSIGFKGIVVTDAMNMGAVKYIADADFKAVLAGNDLILVPADADLLHKKILKLMKADIKTQERIAVSVKKMIRLKLCLGLFTN